MSIVGENEISIRCQSAVNKLVIVRILQNKLILELNHYRLEVDRL